MGGLGGGHTLGFALRRVLFARSAVGGGVFGIASALFFGGRGCGVHVVRVGRFFRRSGFSAGAFLGGRAGLRRRFFRRVGVFCRLALFGGFFGGFRSLFQFVVCHFHSPFAKDDRRRCNVIQLSILYYSTKLGGFQVEKSVFQRFLKKFGAITLDFVYDDRKYKFQNKKTRCKNKTQKKISLFKNSTLGTEYFQKPLDKSKKMCYDNTNRAG